MDLAECRSLLGHAEWADALVWQSALALPQEDAVVQARLHHLHGVQWAYLHVWRGEAIKPHELGTFATRRALCGWAREYFVSVFNTKADVPQELKARIGEKVVFFDADRVSRGREAWIDRWTREIRG